MEYREEPIMKGKTEHVTHNNQCYTLANNETIYVNWQMVKQGLRKRMPTKPKVVPPSLLFSPPLPSQTPFFFFLLFLSYFFSSRSFHSPPSPTLCIPSNLAAPISLIPQVVRRRKKNIKYLHSKGGSTHMHHKIYNVNKKYAF